jgi:hypothetical protein
VFILGPWADVLGLFKKPTFEGCVKEVLIKKTGAHDTKSLKNIDALTGTLTGDAGGLVITNDNQVDTEYQLLSDENVRMAIQGCAASNGGTVSNPPLRSTVSVHFGAGRALRGATVSLFNDSSQSCITDDSGRCPLTLLGVSAADKVQLVAAHHRYQDAKQSLTGSEFLKGVDFVLPPQGHRVKIVVLRNKTSQVENARVELRGPTNVQIWSERCETSGDDADCDWSLTDAHGAAVFYFDASFQDASLDVTIDREQRHFPVEDGIGATSVRTVDWDHASSTTAPPPRSHRRCSYDEMRSAVRGAIGTTHPQVGAVFTGQPDGSVHIETQGFSQTVTLSLPEGCAPISGTVQ